MIVNLILLAVFMVVAFALWRQGAWATMLMLLNILAAATLATAWFETLVAMLEPVFPSYTYLLDFICIWAAFSLTLLVLREVIEKVTPERVKLRKPVELFGTPLLAVIAAWIMVAFTATTLHVAPLPAGMVQPTPDSRMFLGLAPDRKWLQWVRNSSRFGPFGRPDHAFDEGVVAEGAGGDFIIRYHERRKRLAAEEALRIYVP
ncbi:hypothetical protein LBMAG47_27570 [Planctomycetia bacterium]|jgi:hypothetical protein|nr:hypothetical protein LBMAG47_27570 [Planctomycetia bacterium]